MKLSELLNEKLSEEFKPTAEMEKWFVDRTNRHINGVKRNMALMVGFHGLSLPELMSRANQHDSSKYSEDSRDEYVWLSWWWRNKNLGIPWDYPTGLKEKIKEKTGKHIHSERHHPESHIDADDMSLMDIVEMICDWQNVGEEKGNTARKWADKQIGKRWPFNEENKKLIYDAIEWLENKK